MDNSVSIIIPAYNAERRISALYATDPKAEHLLRAINDLRAKRTLANRYMDRAVSAYPATRKFPKKFLQSNRHYLAVNLDSFRTSYSGA